MNNSEIIKKLKFTMTSMPMMSMCKLLTTVETRGCREGEMQRFGVTEEDARDRGRWRLMIHRGDP